MTYLWVYVLIPALAVLIDLVTSYLLLNRMSIFGVAPSSQATGSPNEFIFAVQNDEPRLFENPQRAIQVEFSSRSRHPLNDRETKVCISNGPDDEVTVEARPTAAGTLRVEIPRMRPWKTWVFRIKTYPAVHTIRMELHVPKRSIFRGLLTKINEHTFMFSDVGYHSERIDVSNEPVLKETKGGWKGLLHVVIPMLVLCTWFYGIFAAAYLMPYQDAYRLIPSTARDPKWFDLATLWADALVFVIGFWAICMIARTRSVPIAPGYQSVRPLRTGSRH